MRPTGDPSTTRRIFAAPPMPFSFRPPSDRVGAIVGALPRSARSDSLIGAEPSPLAEPVPRKPILWIS